MKRASQARETAHALVIPSTHGTGNGMIESDDDALMLEALRIASAHLTESAESLEGLMPGAPLVERMRVFAEQMDGLHARLSA